MIKRKQEAGFTLVELAIVMIIIGLLIGGILKGQELISNAETTATIAQIKAFDGAISTFRDKYGVLPGDMNNAATRLRDCVGICATTTAVQNGRIGPNAGVLLIPGVNVEKRAVFSHLAASDLISGVQINGANIIGERFPEADFGGGFWIGYDVDGNIGQGFVGRPGHYLVYHRSLVNVAAASTDGVEAVRAGQVDRKLDDGQPITGDVMSNGNQCRNAGGDYNESAENSSCAFIIRIQS